MLSRPGPRPRTCCERSFARESEKGGVGLCLRCAASRCGTCHGLRGQHAPRCTVGICRGCGTRCQPRGKQHYCAACRASRCPECRRYGGQHRESCLYEQRQRHAPRLTTYRGLVTAYDILTMYVEHKARAVRTAQSIVGAVHAEDVVQDVVLYMFEKRDYLEPGPLTAYFFTAVRTTAFRRRHYAWERYVVPMDPEDLVLAEQAMYPDRARS